MCRRADFDAAVRARHFATVSRAARGEQMRAFLREQEDRLAVAYGPFMRRAEVRDTRWTARRAALTLRVTYISLKHTTNYLHRTKIPYVLPKAP